MLLTVATNDITKVDTYIKKGAKALIFDLKDNSTNNSNITLDDIEAFQRKKKDIEIFVNMNKMVFNNELDNLKETLLKLSKLQIKGVLFYDLAILEIVRKHQIPLDLVWSNTHMVTNYNTCNYFNELGVKYAVISSEITLEEILEIKSKSQILPMVQVLCYQVMAHSKRKLLTNFYKYNNDEYDNSTHKITHQDTYLVKENNVGTTIINGTLLNGSHPLKELLDNDIPYVILADAEIEFAIFENLISKFKKLIEKYNEKTIKEIEKLIGNNTGFFYKKTIYKVK